MKKLVIFLMFLMFFVTKTNAQDFSMKCQSFVSCFKENNWADSKWCEVHPCELVIDFYNDGTYIVMNNKINQKFNLLGVIGRDIGTYKNDLYGLNIYKSVDNNGDTLDVEIFRYKNRTLVLNKVGVAINSKFNDWTDKQIDTIRNILDNNSDEMTLLVVYPKKECVFSTRKELEIE